MGRRGSSPRQKVGLHGLQESEMLDVDDVMPMFKNGDKKGSNCP